MISIVIPTLNEAKYLRATIEHALRQAADPSKLEILVVDAGSSDGTIESIDGLKVQCFSQPDFALKKYQSLNFGVTKSSGDIIVFLDADTLLPKHFDSAILQSLSRKHVVGGAFEFSFENPDWKLLLIKVLNRVRYRIDKRFYGDQAIFVNRTILNQIDGVPKKALMESAYLCRSMSKKGKLALIRPGIVTSPRRFNEHGFFKVAWFDINMFIRFNLGLSVSKYAKKYWSKNLK